MAEPNIDEYALLAARKIDDIYVQSFLAVAQRTSRVQIAIRETLQAYTDAYTRNMKRSWKLYNETDGQETL